MYVQEFISAALHNVTKCLEAQIAMMLGAGIPVWDSVLWPNTDEIYVTFHCSLNGCVN